MKQLLPFLLSVVLLSCNGGQNDNNEMDQTSQLTTDPIELYGNTQGTTFAIICNDPIDLEMGEVNEVLRNFDLALSGYIPNSVVSELNSFTAGRYTYKDSFGYFNQCYLLADSVFKLSNGDFDPTVFPLVDGWGFMKDVENVPDSAVVDSLRALVGFENGKHFTYYSTDSTNLIVKNTPGAKLDFNAIAQGLAVDVLAELLEAKGATNYFVEIGGEIRVHGLNAEGEKWRIGIDKPIENSTTETRALQEVLQLDNKSIATSGSYRKFYEKNGVKYSHTLDPKTGYPVAHSLLSATVVTASCAMADAMATAFMVMGPEKAIAFIESHPETDLEVYLIFINDQGNYETYYTSALGKMIVL